MVRIHVLKDKGVKGVAGLGEEICGRPGREEWIAIRYLKW